jgi:galactonate dehydratase
LGGPVHPRMRVYYSHWSTGLPTGSASAFAERVAESKAQGWDAVKWIVPRAAPESERIARTVRECEGVRNAGGAGFDFGLEMFETFSTRSTIELARAVAPYRPMFIEEPVLREIHGASAEVAAKSPVPLATGEGLLHRYEFKELLDAKGAAIIQPDVIHCGGITEMRKIANLAETYGVELAPHQWYGPIAHVASIQAASVCRNLLIQEWDGANEKLFQDLTAGTFPVQKDGIVSLPQGPGLGLQMDFGEWKRRFPYAPAVR